VALGTRVRNLALAEVATLDQLLILEGLVEVAGFRNVIAGLEVEGSLDGIELGGLDPGPASAQIITHMSL
jgi:hypothetical protein